MDIFKDITASPLIEKRVLRSGEILYLIFTTGCIKIPCHTTAGLISGQQCYEFGVNGTQQSGLVLSRL